MKKVLFLVAVSSVLFSCKKVGENEYVVSGVASDVADGKMVILEQKDPSGQFLAIDTVLVKGGKFEIKGTVTEPAFHVLNIQGKEGKLPFILENGEINIEVAKDSIHKSKVSGTYNNDEFSKFNSDMVVAHKEIKKRMMDFQNTNMQKMIEAQQKGDTATIMKLSKISQQIQNDAAEFYLKYAESHPKSFLSVMIIDGMLEDPTADLARVKKIYDGFDASIKGYKPGKSIQSKLEKGNKTEVAPQAEGTPEVGMMAPDFSAKSPEGKDISLKSVLGKVTIIDFWASWCGPCRGENPNVVALYNELHVKGLNIIGVSLDADAAKWKEAIAKDKLTWNHVSNLKQWEEPIAALYNVKSIPATFILDASGKIIAKDLRGEELKQAVLAALNKK